MINISEIILIRGNLENKIFKIANELLDILGNDNLLISQNRLQELIKLEDNLFTLNSMIEFGTRNCSYTIIGGNLEKQEDEKRLLKILKNKINVHSFYYGYTFNPIGLKNEKWINESIDMNNMIRMILIDLDISGY